MPIFQAIDFSESEEPLTSYKKDCLPDRALVYCQGETVRVLGWIGPGLHWLHDFGSDLSEEVGPPSSDGLWIWEGKLTAVENYNEWDTFLDGVFRPLNTQELDDLADCGLDPWDRSLWLE